MRHSRNEHRPQVPGPPDYGRGGGFSGIDFIFTLAVLALIVAAAVPTVNTTLRTYQRNGAARTLLAEIRTAQSLAVARRAVVALQWGGDPDVGLPASQYRIVRDAGGCNFAAANVAVNGTTVIRGWTDLSRDYGGVTIQSIRDANNTSLGGVMFNGMGASVNTCDSVTFPVTLTLVDASGVTRTLVVRSAGGTQMLY